MNFSGTQTLSGHGQVVFVQSGGGHYPYATNYLQPTDGGTLTIGPGITVHGQDGIVGNGSLPLINQGTITSDQAQAITVTGSTVVNLGILQASGGGQLYVNGLTGNVGLTSLSGTGSLLSLGGTNYVNDLDRTVAQVRR